MDEKLYTLSEKSIEEIARVLSKGNRVELIPVKDGIKIVKVKRETVLNPEKEKK